MNSNIIIEPIPQDVSTGWALYWLKRIEAEITVQPKEYEPRKIRAVMEPPQSSPVQVAVTLFPGNGTQPENTITLQGVADQVQLILQTLEDAVNETIKQSKKGEW